MVTLESGTAITKIPCPTECYCDGYDIPPGSPGIINPTLSANYTQTAHGADGSDKYYFCVWQVDGASLAWWVYRHGFEVDDEGFHDQSYLEDV